MRIVGGALGGRRFEGPPSDLTRPTSERVREALTSALAARGVLEGARVLDLFAGTGALAFEALSRGARDAWLVERNPRVAKIAQQSARALGLDARVSVLRADLLAQQSTLTRTLFTPLSAHAPFGLVFVDPPYAEITHIPALLDALVEHALLTPDATVVLEHAHTQPPADCANLAPSAHYRYGDTGVRFLTLTSP